MLPPGANIDEVLGGLAAVIPPFGKLLLSFLMLLQSAVVYSFYRLPVHKYGERCHNLLRAANNGNFHVGLLLINFTQLRDTNL